MFLTDICNKSRETVKCISNSSLEPGQQEFQFDLNIIQPSLSSSNSGFYEEKQPYGQNNEPPIRPCQSAHSSSEAPAVEIHDKNTISVDLPPLSWHGYNCIPKFLSICNTGQSILINGQWTNGKPYIQGGPLNGSYIFSQIHFHCPSEHEIDGKRFPLEMHVVHYKTSYLTQERAMEEKDGTVVLVYLFQVMDTCDTVLSYFTKHISRIKAVNRQSEIIGIALNHIVKPFYSHYYIYWGSISTKKNSYLLQWIINCSKLYATKQEVHDLFYLLEAGDSCKERRSQLMKPLNNAVYYAGGYTMAFINLEEAATQCNDCYINQVPLMSQCCQTKPTVQSNPVQEKKKDVQVQVCSSENCSVKSSEYIKFCLRKFDIVESCNKEEAIEYQPPKRTCAYDDENKSNQDKKCEKPSSCSVEYSLSEVECPESSKGKSCELLKVPSNPVFCVDTENPPCAIPEKLKKKEKIKIKSLKFENNCSKPPKKKKSCNTENVDLTCEVKEKQCKKKPKCEKKEKKEKKKKEPVEGEPSRKSKFLKSKSKSKSKCKVKVSDEDTLCEIKEEDIPSTSAVSSCTVNYLLTPSILQSIPSLPITMSESEETMRTRVIDSAKDVNLKVSGKTIQTFYSTCQLSQAKLKQPFMEFCLQTEHVFYNKKKEDFSMCASQDYSVTILHKQNVLQEFKGTFSPNKLEVGNCEKLDLIPMYPEPDDLKVHLDDCIVKMETLNKLYIRSKFLLRQPDLNVMQTLSNNLSEGTIFETQWLNPEIKLMDKKKISTNNQNSKKRSSFRKFIKKKSSKNVKQIKSHKLFSKKSEKRDYEIELLKSPPEEVETSKSNVLDYADQPLETKVVEEGSQKSLGQKSERTLRNLFRKRKKTLFFTCEKVEKDESSGKKVFVGKFRTKSGKVNISNEKLPQSSVHYSTSEKPIEIKGKDFVLLPDKKLVELNCESPNVQQEQKRQSLNTSKEFDVDNVNENKCTVTLHPNNSETLKPKSSKNKRATSTTSKNRGFKSLIPISEKRKRNK